MYSFNAASMRVCHPLPDALKYSMTSNESLILMRSFGFSNLGRPLIFNNLELVVASKISGNTSLAGRAAIKVFFCQIGLSESAISGCFRFFIHSYFPWIGLTKANDVNHLFSGREHNDMHSRIKISHRQKSSLAIIMSMIFLDERTWPFKFQGQSEGQPPR